MWQWQQSIPRIGCFLLPSHKKSARSPRDVILRLLKLHYPEILHTEQLLWVCPHAFNDKSRCSCQSCKLLQRVLVRTLCPDALAQLEGDLDLPMRTVWLVRLTRCISIRLCPGL